jgi:hypothetical protein
MNPGGGIPATAGGIAGGGENGDTKEADETENPGLLPIDETVFSSSPIGGKAL